MIVMPSQAVVRARTSDADPAVLFEIIGHFQINAPIQQTKGHALPDRNFVPRFLLEYLPKDVNPVPEAAQQAGTPMPGVACLFYPPPSRRMVPNV
jgi:3-hydroxyisobutyrate dehydrogenase-like beta-hydroxyacid dehydrogenase